MAGLMDNLTTLLAEECQCYEQLVEVSTQKTQTIVKGDIEALQKITVAEQTLTDRVQNLEKKRLETVKDIGIVIGKEDENLTITRIIELMSGQPQVQGTLSELKLRLIKALNEMKAVNDKNTVLLKQAMEMVEFDLTLLKGLKQAPETANYNKNAYNTGTLLGGSGFDFKQ